MTLEDHSFRHLLPTFHISPGTQVVLKVDKPLPDGTVRPRGSVAVVAESPADNERAYTLHFADGQTVPAYFRELAIRRKEVEDQLRPDRRGSAALDHLSLPGRLAPSGWPPRTPTTTCGESTLPPARLHWSLFKLPEQLEFEDADGTRSTGSWRSSSSWP